MLKSLDAVMVVLQKKVDHLQGETRNETAEMGEGGLSEESRKEPEV